MADFNLETFLEVYECMYCDMICHHSAALRSHIYHKHTKGIAGVESQTTAEDTEKKKKKKTSLQRFSTQGRTLAIHNCGLCDSDRMTSKKLDSHLVTVHDLDLSMYRQSFESMQGFLMWKLKYSAETCAEFIKVFQAKRRNSLQVQTYTCSVNGSRKRKTKETCTGHCPARIITYLAEDGRVEIKYIKTHVGHQHDVSRLKHATIQYLKSKHLMEASTDMNTDKRLLQEVLASTDEYKRTLLSCVHCDFKNKEKGTLNEHLRNSHGYQVIQRTINFPTPEDFTVWLRQYSEETQSQFVRYGPTPTLGTASITHYVCDRDGSHRRTKKNYNMFRSTKKLNGYCPVKITATVTVEGSTQADYVMPHVHDPTPPRPPKMDHVRMRPYAPRNRRNCYTCAHCDFKNSNKNIMNEHMIQAHDYDLAQHSIVFPTPEEFFVWLKKYSEDTKTLYWRMGKVPAKGVTTRTYYMCKRQSNKEHKLRRVSYCPARITVTVDEEGRTHARYISTHSKHEPVNARYLAEHAEYHPTPSVHEPAPSVHELTPSVHEPAPSVHEPAPVSRQKKDESLAEVLVVTPSCDPISVALPPPSEDLLDWQKSRVIFGVYMQLEHSYAAVSDGLDDTPVLSSPSGYHSKAIIYPRPEPQSPRTQKKSTLNHVGIDMPWMPHKNSKYSIVNRVSKFIQRGNNCEIMEHIMTVLENCEPHEELAYFKRPKKKPKTILNT